jgi:uridine kinase
MNTYKFQALSIFRLIILFLVFLEKISVKELLLILFIEILLLVLVGVVAKSYPSIYLWYLSPLPLFLYSESSYFPIVSAIFAIFAIHFASLKNRFFLAGVFFGVAAIFLSPITYTLPFLIIYALANPRHRRPMSRFILAETCVLVVWQMFVLLFGRQADLLSNISSRWALTSAQVDFQAFSFYPLAALYVAFLIWLYRAGRFTPKSLFVFIAAFTIVGSLLVYQTSEIAIWGVMLLLYLLDFSNIRLCTVLFIFQVLVVTREILSATTLSEFIGVANLSIVDFAIQLTTTILLCYTGFFAIRLTKLAFLAGDPYRLAKKPIVISIAGDSGVGKDKLANLISLAFGSKYTSVLCGDNYHLFERNGIEWRSRSHLNPAMNDLLTWKQDLRKAQARDVFVSPLYDHSTGIIGKQSNNTKSDLIISQGLHALYEELVSDSDISIFLELEDDLRIKFKIDRDTSQRGRTKDEIEKQIAERSVDYIKYIQVQKNRADFVFRIESDLDGHPSILRISTNKHYAVLRQVEQNLLTYLPEILAGRNVDEKYEINLVAGSFSGETLHFFLKSTLDSYADLFPNSATIDDNMNGLAQVLIFSLLSQIRLDVK